MRHRRAPRRLGSALRPARARARPKTLLAAVQESWPGIAGKAIATESEPAMADGPSAPSAAMANAMARRWSPTASAWPPLSRREPRI